MDFIETVTATLANHTRRELPAGPVPAAVLLLLLQRNDGFHILFTKRSGHLHHHGGEVSFPGGVRHSEDGDLLQTALRETWEELGILPDNVKVLGILDDFYSIHHYLVTPYVGIIPGNLPLIINQQEIERIIEVPVPHLLQPGFFRTEDWTWKGRKEPVHFFTYGDDEIWGMTAAILKNFLDLVFSESECPWH